jgi:uncharacterized phage protein (TIGR02218 family)
MPTYRRTIGPGGEFSSIDAWNSQANYWTNVVGSIEEGVILPGYSVSDTSTQLISGTATPTAYKVLLSGEYDSTYVFDWQGQGSIATTVDVTVTIDNVAFGNATTKANFDTAAEIQTFLNGLTSGVVVIDNIWANSGSGTAYQIFFSGANRGVDVLLEITVGTSGTFFQDLIRGGDCSFDLVRKEGGYVTKDLRRSVGSTGYIALRVESDYTELRNFGMYAAIPLGEPTFLEGFHHGISIAASNCILDGVSVKYNYGYTGDNIICFVDDGSNTKFYNCIAIGGRRSDGSKRGADYGFFTSVTTGTAATYYNCLAYGCYAYGFGLSNRLDPTLKFKNNLAFSNTGSFQFNPGVSHTNIDYLMSDGSVPSQGANNVGFVGIDQMFSNRKADDFRNLLISPGLNTGEILYSEFTTDFAKQTRLGLWSRGPYEDYSLPSGAAPRTVVKTIGVGGDYATIDEWEADTRVNLVGKNEIQVGEVIEDNLYPPTFIYGAIGDATHYRVLRASEQYIPRNAVGTRINSNATRVIERGFRIERLGIFSSLGGGIETEDQFCLGLFDEDIIVDRCLIDGTESISGSASGNRIGISINDDANNVRVSNSQVIGRSGVGFNVGIKCYQQNNVVANCVVKEINDGLQGIGIGDSGNLSWECTNNIVFGCETSYSITRSSSFNNMSDDSNSSVEFSDIDMGQVFVNHIGRDLRLRENSLAENLGINLSKYFTTDFLGLDRFLPWELGAYNGIAYSPPTATVRPGASQRRCKAIIIERTDGVILRLTDSNSLISFRGGTFYPSGSAKISASSHPAGMKDSSLDAAGAFSSLYISNEDLRAGRFDDAVVSIFIIDWKYPWAEPFRADQWRIQRVSYDDDTWRAELAGPSSWVVARTGGQFNRQCDTILGSDRCGINLPSLTSFGATVGATISDPRRKFSAVGLNNIPESGYYVFGALKWVTGLNAGLISEVKIDTKGGSDREIEVQLRLPFDVQTGDSFDLGPGCDLTFSTCKSKFINWVNFQGMRFMENTDKLMQTPTSF